MLWKQPEGTKTLHVIHVETSAPCAAPTGLIKSLITGWIWCNFSFCSSVIKLLRFLLSMWLKSWRSCCSGWWELQPGWRWTGPWTRFWAASSCTTYTSGSVSIRRFSAVLRFPLICLNLFHAKVTQKLVLTLTVMLGLSIQATSTWCLHSSRGSCGTEVCRPALAWPLPSRCCQTWWPCSPSTSTASTSTEPGMS